MTDPFDIGEDSDALKAEFAFQKGLVYLRKGEYANARANFRDATRLNPTEGDYAGYAAWADHVSARPGTPGLFSTTRDRLFEATHLSPKRAQPNYFLGELHLGVGDVKSAKRWFTEALSVDPEHKEARQKLQLCLKLERRKPR